MKIQIKGTYFKSNSHWVVEIPYLLVRYEGLTPNLAFQKLQDLIHAVNGSEGTTSFKVSDDGHFVLVAGKTKELVSFIAKQIYLHAKTPDDIGRVLANIRFEGDLHD